ncbi:hypothetical protein FKM82_022963 [Ascaphus truei]
MGGVSLLILLCDLFLQFGGQTNPGRVHQCIGGVGKNLADGLSRLGMKPLFISALGQDEHSHSVMRYCGHMDMAGVARLKGHSSATYCAVITESGEVNLGLGDFAIHQQITDTYVRMTHFHTPCISGNCSKLAHRADFKHANTQHRSAASIALGVMYT